MPKKYARKKKSTNKVARKVVKVAKSLMLRQVETKQYCPGYIQQLKNEAIYSFSPTQSINVGNTSTTRVGDSLLLQSLIISGRFEVNAAVLNCKTRLLIGYSNVEDANVNVSDVVFGATDIFVASGTVALTDRIVDPHKFSPVYDEMFDINSNTTTGQDIKSYYRAVNLKMKKFDYRNQGGSLGKFKNLYVIAISNSPSPTPTPNFFTCKWHINANLKFKDP